VQAKASRDETGLDRVVAAATGNDVAARRVGPARRRTVRHRQACASAEIGTTQCPLWGAMEGAGPAASVAASDEDVDRYLDVLATLVTS
jgi:hypothetical protein